MLVLQRKLKESLIINNDIKITIMDIGTDKVKLAIEAPKEVPVLRSELVEAAINNREAAHITPEAFNALKQKSIMKPKKK